MLTKNETNNAIITRLHNVRKHPNADRIKLATVLGTQVIVGLDAQDGDLVIYFDSNLRLSPAYLHYNNLYSSKEMNANKEVKGYFEKNGRVRAQKFRGEISNGYVAELYTIDFVGIHPILKEGDEFTHINGIEICSKYIVPMKGFQGQSGKQVKPISDMFRKHWDTKQLMRELDSIPEDTVCYIEEKIHGTSGRTGKVLCKTNRPWWKFWVPKQEWKIISGTRRVDSINNHIPQVREEIERKVTPHLHKGEEIYYEIYGYDINGSPIQSGSLGPYSYGCRPGEFKAILYRVTVTTLDGFVLDLSREQVYKRAEELGLEKPILLYKGYIEDGKTFGESTGWSTVEGFAIHFSQGKSALDASTLREGVVVWFEDRNGNWNCLKHKSEEFLLEQSKYGADTPHEESHYMGDIEDIL